MNQLTIRGFSPELESAIKETAQARGISLNRAALYLMRQGAGIRQPNESLNLVGDKLDAYFGVMKDADAEEIQDVLKQLDQVQDETFWK